MSADMDRRPVPRRARARCARAAVLLLGLLASAACAQPFAPRLDLGQRGEPVPLRVRVAEFSDETPAADRRAYPPLGRSLIPRSDREPLSALVRDLLIAEFARTSVFAEIGETTRPADLVLTGTPRRFYGKQLANPTVMIPYLHFLSFIPVYPTLWIYGEVNLELRLARPDGTVVGVFSGREEFSDPISLYRLRPFGSFDARERLNLRFQAVVEKLVAELRQDRERLASEHASGEARESP